MRESRGRMFDDFSRIVSDASGMAQGVRREAEAVIKGQAERLLSAMDIPSREEFEAVRQMAIMARDENERLERRIRDLEAKLGTSGTPLTSAGDPSL